MPVPSSYNDITEEASLRDHIGWVWYDREFYVPRVWNGAEIRLRIGSANFHATVVSRLLKYFYFVEFY